MSGHQWQFFKTGGHEQVALRNGNDVINLDTLDPKLWVALALPVKGTELDARTLELIDTDKDGRIRVPEIRAAVRFVAATFVDPEDIVRGGDGLSLAAIKDDKVKAAAARVLAAIGKPKEGSIAIADMKAYTDVVAGLKLNGDGVVPPDSVDDEAARAVVGEILDTVGGADDKSGKKGVTQAQVDTFFKDAQALVEWHAKGAADKALLPLGEATFAAAAAAGAVRAKIEDYFTRCRLAGLDPRAAAAMNGSEADFAALGGKQLAAAEPDVARLPLSRIEAGRALPLKDGVNPAWNGPLATFATAAAAPLVRPGLDKLTEAEWTALGGKLAAHDGWAAVKPASPVDKLGAERLRAVLAGKTRETLDALLKDDLAQAELINETVEVERALRYKRDLHEVLCNSVNFSRFYHKQGAAFQAGTLFLDGRGCALCIEVADAGKHAALAGMSGAYLTYCDVTRPGEKKTIVAAFTGGDADNLFVGRNGVFFDRAGRDWDATITKVIENPISVGQAFWAPYKKLVRMIEEQVAKRAAAKDTEGEALLTKAATATATVDQTKAPAAAAVPPKKGVDVGTVAAIGVAVGGIGAMVVGIMSVFFGLGPWIPLAMIGVLLAISGPSMVIAWLKLRRRNLGPLLDANGWAINGRARINVPFGRALTDLPHLPPGSHRSLNDPYAEKSRPWALYIVLLVVLVLGALWLAGKLDPVLPEGARSVKVLG